MTLPFIYIGTGQLKDPKERKNPKKSLHFNVELDKSLPKDLKFDLMELVKN